MVKKFLCVLGVPPRTWLRTDLLAIMLLCCPRCTPLMLATGLTLLMLILPSRLTNRRTLSSLVVSVGSVLLVIVTCVRRVIPWVLVLATDTVRLPRPVRAHFWWYCFVSCVLAIVMVER